MGRPPLATTKVLWHDLRPASSVCLKCGHTAWMANHTSWIVTTLHGRYCLQQRTVRHWQERAWENRSTSGILFLRL